MRLRKKLTDEILHRQNTINWEIDREIFIEIFIDWEIFIAEKLTAMTFKDKNETNEMFSSAYKWSKFMWSSGHSDENKARRKIK